MFLVLLFVLICNVFFFICFKNTFVPPQFLGVSKKLFDLFWFGGFWLLHIQGYFHGLVGYFFIVAMFFLPFIGGIFACVLVVMLCASGVGQLQIKTPRETMFRKPFTCGTSRSFAKFDSKIQPHKHPLISQTMLPNP